MIRSLFIIAAAGLVLTIVCLGGAAAIGGREIARDGWTITGDGWSLTRGDFHFQSSDEAMETHQIDWEGGEALTFDLPARVIYAQGDEPSVTITAPAAVVDRISFEGGRFQMADGFRADRQSRPRITIIAPAVSRFTLNGSQRLEIRDYDQPTLDIALSGSGDVEGYGRAERLTVHVDGSGDVDLDELRVAEASIQINGSGDVEVAPAEAADIVIRGSGDVTLAVQPVRVTSEISGSGRVRRSN